MCGRGERRGRIASPDKKYVLADIHVNQCALRTEVSGSAIVCKAVWYIFRVAGDGADRRQRRIKGSVGRESYEQTRGASARRSMRR